MRWTAPAAGAATSATPPSRRSAPSAAARARIRSGDALVVVEGGEQRAGARVGGAGVLEGDGGPDRQRRQGEHLPGRRVGEPARPEQDDRAERPLAITDGRGGGQVERRGTVGILDVARDRRGPAVARVGGADGQPERGERDDHRAAQRLRGEPRHGRDPAAGEDGVEHAQVDVAQVRDGLAGGIGQGHGRTLMDGDVSHKVDRVTRQ